MSVPRSLEIVWRTRQIGGPARGCDPIDAVAGDHARGQPGRGSGFPPRLRAWRSTRPMRQSPANSRQGSAGLILGGTRDHQKRPAHRRIRGLGSSACPPRATSPARSGKGCKRRRHPLGRPFPRPDGRCRLPKRRRFAAEAVPTGGRCPPLTPPPGPSGHIPGAGVRSVVRLAAGVGGLSGRAHRDDRGGQLSGTPRPWQRPLHLLGAIDEPVEWLLFSDFRVILALAHPDTLCNAAPIFIAMMRIAGRGCGGCRRIRPADALACHHPADQAGGQARGEFWRGAGDGGVFADRWAVAVAAAGAWVRRGARDGPMAIPPLVALARKIAEARGIGCADDTGLKVLRRPAMRCSWDRTGGLPPCGTRRCAVFLWDDAFRLGPSA